MRTGPIRNGQATSAMFGACVSAFFERRWIGCVRFSRDSKLLAFEAPLHERGPDPAIIPQEAALPLMSGKYSMRFEWSCQ